MITIINNNNFNKKIVALKFIKPGGDNDILYTKLLLPFKLMIGSAVAVQRAS